MSGLSFPSSSAARCLCNHREDEHLNLDEACTRCHCTEFEYDPYAPDPEGEDPS